jgi:hypothetical protein
MERRFGFVVAILLVAGLWTACGGDGSAAPDALADTDPGMDVAGDPGTDSPGDLPQDDKPVDVPGDAPLADDGVDDTAQIPFPELDPAVCRLAAPIDLLGFNPAYVPPTGTSILQDKAWFLLTALMQVPDARAAVTNDPALLALSTARTAALRDAAATCGADATCHAVHLSWSAKQITDVATDLARVLKTTNVTATHLRPSGRFTLFADLDDDALVIRAATEALTTLQATFDNYARPRPDLETLVSTASTAHPDALLFFEPLLHLALAGVKADESDQAEQFEPLAVGENKKALERAATIQWDDWRFTVILVLGWGPDDLAQPLSDTGREHCDIAATRWQAGLAPFLLLSGGAVHPDRTPYFEAIEMKKYLVETLLIPEDAILVDPHARHTTTNVRNASRLMLRAGIPTDHPALISSDFLQAPYVTALGVRCMADLGYLPWSSMAQLSDNDDCWLPSPVSLYGDARDPQDP